MNRTRFACRNVLLPRREQETYMMKLSRQIHTTRVRPIFWQCGATLPMTTDHRCTLQIFHYKKLHTGCLKDRINLLLQSLLCFFHNISITVVIAHVQARIEDRTVPLIFMIMHTTGHRNTDCYVTHTVALKFLLSAEIRRWWWWWWFPACVSSWKSRTTEGCNA